MITVGKKYKVEGYHDVYECLFIGEQRIFMRNTIGNAETTFLKSNAFTEHHEPQTIVGYVNVYRMMNGKLEFGTIHYRENEAEKARKTVLRSEYLATHRIEYTA